MTEKILKPFFKSRQNSLFSYSRWVLPGLSGSSPPLEGALLDSWVFTSLMTSENRWHRTLAKSPAATSLLERPAAALFQLLLPRQHQQQQHEGQFTARPWPVWPVSLWPDLHEQYQGWSSPRVICTTNTPSKQRRLAKISYGYWNTN